MPIRFEVRHLSNLEMDGYLLELNLNRGLPDFKVDMDPLNWS